MSTPLKIAAIGILFAAQAPAQVVVKVEAAKEWVGFMNVMELPENNDGALVFGSAWGTADLRAEFEGSTLRLSPNTIDDPDPFWYQGGGGPGSPGNKIMGANLFVQEDGALAGETVVFEGQVNEVSFTAAHSTVAFIRDFSPDFSSFEEVSVALDAPGPFSISLDTIDDPARHVQYGFETTGENVWVTDVEPFGSIEIEAIPVPAADPEVTVDPGADWNGFMNVFDSPDLGRNPRPELGGDWAFEDLRASFSGDVLTLAPNTFIPESGLGLDDPEWFFQGEGDKVMEANAFVQFPPGSVTGETIRFSGTVTANTLTSEHTAIAFIRLFSPDFSELWNEVTAALDPGGFELMLDVGDNPDANVQYGFQMVGPNVWPPDAEPFGSVQVTTGIAPEPGFDDWVGGFDFGGFEAPDLSPTGDPDGDGISNFEEFALNGDPSDSADGGKRFAELAALADGTALVVTVAVRGQPEFTGAPALTTASGGVSYVVEGSNDLASFDQSVSELTPARTEGLPAIDDGWSYRSFRLDGAVGGAGSRGPRGFLRVQVSEAP